MQFEVLGPLRATTADGRVVSLGPPRQQVLLAVLLVHRQRVLSATRLIDAVWRDDPVAVSHATLQAYISRLRGVLRREAGQDVTLETRRPGYVLHLADEDLDAARFERLATEGRAALSRGEAHTASRQLTEALDLWRGPALDGLTDESELLAAEARRLEELRLAALSSRIQADLALGRHGDLVSELEALVASHPYREQLWGHLMVALYRAGRQADALATYQRASDRLAEDLGIDPSEELQSLHQQVLRQDPALAAPAPAETPPTASGFRLPASREAPLGRDEEVAALQRLLRENRLVTVTGPGGAGKTTLALHVGRLVESEFPDGAALVDLAPAEGPRDVGAAAHAALGSHDHPEETSLSGVVRAIGDRDMLLVLDNCEHVLSAAGELADIVLSACPRARVLATTRQPLDVAGEQWWPLAPLAVPSQDADAAEIEANPAVSLLVRRAQAIDPHFRLDDADVNVAAQLVRQLDGLPLAIELAAVRLTSLSLGEIAAHLEAPFRLLRGGPRTADTRHQTLENTIAWSEQLLHPSEQQTLMRLAALPGGAGTTTARRVVFDSEVDDLTVADVLDGLARKSLLAADRSGPRTRYRMLETVRTYFLGRLEETEGSQKTRHRLATYLLELAQEAGEAIKGRDPADALSRLDDELANLVAVRNWALEETQPTLLFELVTALPLAAEWRVRPQLYEVMDLAADLAERLDHTEWPAVAAATAVSMSVRGDPERAKRQLAVALERLPREHPLRPVALVFRVHVALMVGETETAIDAARLCLQEPATAADGFHETLAQSSLAFALATAGRREEALPELERVDELLAAQDSPSLAAWCAYVHGEALGDERPQQAQYHYQRAIELGRRSGADAVTGVALIGLCSLEGRQGAPQQALPVFADALTHHFRGGRWQMCWTALLNLTELLCRVDEPEAALEILGAADASPTCPPVYGDAADRRATVASRAEAALGEQAAARARGRGSCRDEAATVRTALATVARAQTSPPPGQRHEHDVHREPTG